MDQSISNQNNKLVDRKYQVLSCINSSMNSKVKLVKQIGSSQNLAMKIMKNKGILQSLLLNELKNEIMFLSRFNDKHIVKLIDYNLSGELRIASAKKTKKISYMVLEYAEKGEIFNYLKKSKGFPLPIAKYYFKQLLIGLKSMHSESVYHRDLKLENLLLDKDFNLKIIDFGFATSNAKDSNVLGTDFYMAPEMVLRKEYQPSKCDMFSAGVILFTFIRGNFPFKIASQNEINYSFFYAGNEKDFWKLFGKTRKSY